MFWTRSTCPLTPAAGSGGPGGLHRGSGHEHFEREPGELRALHGGDANVVLAVLGRRERQRGLALAFGFLALDRGQLRAHGVVDVDGGVERAGGGEVDGDAFGGGDGAGCTRRSWWWTRGRTDSCSPASVVAPTVVPSMVAGRLCIGLRVDQVVVGGRGRWRWRGRCAFAGGARGEHHGDRQRDGERERECERGCRENPPTCEHRLESTPHAGRSPACSPRLSPKRCIAIAIHRVVER